jgi:secreted trypsin-like serine protease
MSARRIIAAAASLLSIACADQSSPVAPLENTKPLLITSGQPDQGAHPYVGLLVFDDANGPAWRCTGALLSPTVVLTAGHCTDGAIAARIWMDEVVQGNPQYPLGGTSSYEGTPNTYPGYCLVCRNFSILRWLEGDVGIVVLSEPVPISVVASYVQLPSVGLASTLANKSDIRHAGYGDQVRLVGGGPPVTAGVLRRLTTVASLISGKFDNSENLLRLSSNAAQGKGGTCFGDSGGPNLVGSSHVTIAVTSYGTNGNCTGSDYATRIDVTNVLNWIQGFLD